MRLLRIPLSAILLMLLFSQCGSSPCGIASLDYGLVGFTDNEAGDIVLRKFQKNSNFSEPADTVVVQATFSRTNDTLSFASIVSDGLLLSHYDYEIYFGAAARLYRITNIVEEQKETRYSIFRPRKDGCINAITQLTINGQVQNTVRFNRFYIVK